MKKIIITERQFDKIINRITEEAYYEGTSNYELIELNDGTYELNILAPLDLDDNHEAYELIDELVDKGYSDELIGDLNELEDIDYDGNLEITYSGNDNDYRDIWSLTDFLNSLMRKRLI